MKAPTMPGVRKKSLEKVEDYDDADAILYKSSGGEKWYRVEVKSCIEYIGLVEGPLVDLKRSMVENKLKTYALATQHVCEHPGCNRRTEDLLCKTHGSVS